jgi:hypothetical protein
MLALPPAQPLGRRTVDLPDHDPALRLSGPPAVEVAPTVVQMVSVEPIQARTDLLTDETEWTWAELRDYVVAQITERFGAFPRDSRKEYGIFSRFLNTYGADAVAIAKYAFGPACDGWWGRAPISVNRFAKGSDPYFAKPILERLADASL